ncbi:MAG: GxxExxY protein [Planctomycetes bacterium]|nr:GxxExxY protein [Planctomycetota bacterium]
MDQDRKTPSIEEINDLTSKIIGAGIAVHTELGPGIYESVYQNCMVIELRRQGLTVEAQVPVAVYYRGEKVADEGFRMDLLVEGTVVVELKSVEEVKRVHKKQVLTYVRLAKKPLGLLINFSVDRLSDGVYRIIDTKRGEGKGPLTRALSWLLSVFSVFSV